MIYYVPVLRHSISSMLVVNFIQRGQRTGQGESNARSPDQIPTSCVRFPPRSLSRAFSQFLIRGKAQWNPNLTLGHDFRVLISLQERMYGASVGAVRETRQRETALAEEGSGATEYSELASIYLQRKTND